MTVSRKVRDGELTALDDGDEDDDEMLPRTISWREGPILPKTTFSVLEGVGRTLKGRDLRQVRNAVWRHLRRT
ncbi:pleckstrin homology (PH) domain-containing protein [Actinidia rufa]|uniref:Pleckstrin homology (PH) domain-containing protein n=1 Tax=Actinidia rufa TaxID=165716 RepID=A0A7J0GZT3_9ERIC|nr:pleckstrin homology (PH) domain-containing protein [Actinidia rufa]